MSKQDIMKVIAEIHNKLYQVSFSGDQMLVVSDCIIQLRGLLQALNRTEPDAESQLAE